MNSDTTPQAPSFREALRLWMKLGWVSFGGPAGQIALMHDEIVHRRRWMSDEHFLHALNFCMLLPGPEAQQLATYLGWRLHGARGGIAAGVLFVLPSVFILFALSWAFMAGGNLGWVQGIFHGLMPAVIAIMLIALKRIGSKSLKSASLWAIAGLSFAAIFQFRISFVLILLAAALIGFLGHRYFPKQFPAGSLHGSGGVADDDCVVLKPAARASVRRTVVICSICVMVWALPLSAIAIGQGMHGIHLQEGWFFTKAALVTFGGAYAVLPYVSQMAVDHYGWLGQRQMMAGLGLAETTPGPLIMVLQFVGFVAAWQHPPAGWSPLASGVLGAFITTWVTFLPCFLFVFLGAPHVEGLRNRPAIVAALTAITGAVVGVILNLVVSFSVHALRPETGGFDYFVAVTAIFAWLAMAKLKLGTIPVLAACAILGILYRAFVG
jgi:chromate transporter